MSAQKLDVPSMPSDSTNTTNDNEIQQQQQQKNYNAKRKRHDYVHAMISNRHCKIYCLLSGSGSGSTNTNNTTNTNNRNHKNNNHPPPEMEVFVEDTSGNGTLINGTTLLRRNERRKLHTGDVICLLNPKLLSKKIKSAHERKMYMSQYSYVFVNLYEQECRFGRGLNMMMMGYSYSQSQSQSQQSSGNGGRFSLGGGGGSSSSRGGGGRRGGSPSNNSKGRSGSPSNNRGGRKFGSPSRFGKKGGGGGSPSTRSSNKKSAVNPRATKCHSINTTQGNNNKQSLFSPAAGAAAARGRSNLPIQQRNKNSLGSSFLNNHYSNLQSSSSSSNDNNNNHKNGSSRSTTTTSSTQRQRRVEEEYDLRDLLGTGTCGEVRRAIHRRTGEERAVKIIGIGGRNSAMPTGMSTEKLSAIQAEATILRSLDHPYVVKLFDMYVSPGKAIYLVMELIKGGDLFDRIVEREVYTEVQARRLFRRILNAVYYLHEERGIVHRDLKPENILVVDRRNDVNIKLTDFGLGKGLFSSPFVAPFFFVGQFADNVMQSFVSILYKLTDDIIPLAYHCNK